MLQPSKPCALAIFSISSISIHILFSFLHPSLGKVTYDDEYRKHHRARDADANHQRPLAVFIFRVEEKGGIAFIVINTRRLVLGTFALDFECRQ